MLKILIHNLILDYENPYYVGRIGTIGQRAGNFSLQNADLLICLGTRNNIRQVSYNWENFGKNAYKIMVDIDETELEKPLVVPDLKINADLKDFIESLNNANIKTQIEWSDWLDFCKNLKTKYSYENHPEQEQGEREINPYYLTYTLSKCMGENDILVMTNGSACVCPFQNAIVKKGQRFILNSGNASTKSIALSSFPSRTTTERWFKIFLTSSFFPSSIILFIIS